MKSPINMNENVPHFEKISVLFFDLGEISRFDSFFDRQVVQPEALKDWVLRVISVIHFVQHA